jgi:hypothetical protein
MTFCGTLMTYQSDHTVDGNKISWFLAFLVWSVIGKTCKTHWHFVFSK